VATLPRPFRSVIQRIDSKTLLTGLLEFHGKRKPP
jgi:hypothetical protein